MSDKSQETEKKSTVIVEPDVHREIRIRVASEGGKIGEYVDRVLRKALGLPSPSRQPASE